jgi:hypothetical protein
MVLDRQKSHSIPFFTTGGKLPKAALQLSLPRLQSF